MSIPGSYLDRPDPLPDGRPTAVDTEPVSWTGWEPGLRIIHLDQTCTRCRHPAPAETCRGLALPPTQAGTAPIDRYPVVRLFAFRCPACMHVGVYDRGPTGMTWTDITGECDRLF